MIEYVSTRGRAPAVDFETALFAGLAPDGGLYFPTRFPRFSAAELTDLRGKPLPTVGATVLQKWFGDEIEPAALAGIATEALHFDIPLQQVGPYQILELFHGPTMAFKDVAAQTLSRLMSHFLQKRREKVTLLVATSGDTGGAIAHGFANVPNIDVFVLFPRGRVSALQQEQLTRVADNVHPLEIDGMFDDCQALVKRAFTDEKLTPLRLTSANSISIGRLIPQIIYYVHAYAQTGRPDLQLVVPSGNFGNLTGGLFARQMGVPLPDFVAATNRNDAAVRYLETGRYEPRPTIPTLSNAMDVGDPSNFVRILQLFDRSHERVKGELRAVRVTDDEAMVALQQVWENHAYLLDPHTAVGWHAAEQAAAEQGGSERPVVIVGTASPLKFAGEIEARSGIRVDDSAAIAALQERPSKKKCLPADYEAFRELLLGIM